MIKNTWVMVAGIVAGFNLLLVTANTAIASGDLLGSKESDLQVDGRERTRVAAPQHPFSFVAQNACNEDTDVCFRVWGSGFFNTDKDQITAAGNFERVSDNVQRIYSRWYAVDLISGSDKDVTFKAGTTRGSLYIIVDEGDRKNPAKVCMYGELIGMSSAEDALCTEDVRVNIR
jgi:hypothetical protein